MQDNPTHMYIPVGNQSALEDCLVQRASLCCVQLYHPWLQPNAERGWERRWSVETVRGTQSRNEDRAKTDKEPGRPPASLPLVLLLAPPLSATRKISLLIHSSRLYYFHFSLSLSLRLWCVPLAGIYTDMRPHKRELKGWRAPPWSSFNSEGVFGLKRQA